MPSTPPTVLVWDGFREIPAARERRSPPTTTSAGAITAAQFGQNEEALASFCGGDDSNMLSAGLAVAIGQELGRWDVNTDFAVVSGKVELSATGKLRCGATGASCPKTYALFRDDATSNITNHSPSAYRTKLTGWYNTQKTALTNKVNTLAQQAQSGVHALWLLHC